MTTLIIIGVLFVALTGSSALARRYKRQRDKYISENDALKINLNRAITNAKTLEFEIKKRDALLKRQGEIHAEAQQKKDTLKTGDNASRFDASLDILSDLADSD